MCEGRARLRPTSGWEADEAALSSSPRTFLAGPGDLSDRGSFVPGGRVEARPQRREGPGGDGLHTSGAHLPPWGRRPQTQAPGEGMAALQRDHWHTQ